jgi:glycerophosphoryl diester phosphodiesterase
MIAACTEANLPVFVWTVDDVSVARNLIDKGVAGLFTNDPAKLKAAFPGAVPPV